MAPPHLLNFFLSNTGRTLVLKNDIDSNLKLLELLVSKTRAARMHTYPYCFTVEFHLVSMLFHFVTYYFISPCGFN